MYVPGQLNELTLLNTKVRSWARLWRAPGLSNCVSVTFSERMQRSFGALRAADRRLVTISVTSNPTAEWIAGQVTDAFPWDEAPRHL